MESIGYSLYTYNHWKIISEGFLPLFYDTDKSPGSSRSDEAPTCGDVATAARVGTAPSAWRGQPDNYSKGLWDHPTSSHCTFMMQTG